MVLAVHDTPPQDPPPVTLALRVVLREGEPQPADYACPAGHFLFEATLVPGSRVVVKCRQCRRWYRFPHGVG